MGFSHTMTHRRAWEGAECMVQGLNPGSTAGLLLPAGRLSQLDACMVVSGTEVRTDGRGSVQASETETYHSPATEPGNRILASEQASLYIGKQPSCKTCAKHMQCLERSAGQGSCQEFSWVGITYKQELPCRLIYLCWLHCSRQASGDPH